MLRKLIVSLLLVSCAIAVDQTRKKQAYGNQVVFATIKQIQDTCIFPNDLQFMRRVAWVESQFGNFIQRMGYWNKFKGQGGIWQVDPATLTDTQNRLKAARKSAISKNFGIDFTKLNRANGDLEVPIYGALASRSVIYLINNPIPISIDDQASYWKQYYNSKLGNGTVEGFKNKVAAIPKICYGAGADLLFILDSSGSIGSNTFNNVRKFVQLVVENLDLSIETYQIGIDDFSSIANTIVAFNGYSSKTDLIAKIKTIPYYGDGTATADALYHAASKSFTTAQGARDPSLGYPRIAVLVTDGQPNSVAATQNAAIALKSTGVELFAVGVGNNVAQSLMNYLASQPKCMHTYSLDSYSHLAADFPDELRSRSCQAVAAAPDNGTQIQNAISQNQSLHIEFKANISTGISFHLNMKTGQVIMYISTSVRNPSSIMYDFKIQADTSRKQQIYISPKQLQQKSSAVFWVLSDRTTDDNSTIPVFTTIQGVSASNNFTLVYQPGDTTSGAARSSSIWIFTIIVFSVLMR